jgi:hypothetical protein
MRSCKPERKKKDVVPGYAKVHMINDVDARLLSAIYDSALLGYL